MEVFDERDLANQVYSLGMVSRLKPVILNFDDLFRKYELQLIKKFIEGNPVP